jgi:hypothetical protein
MRRALPLVFLLLAACEPRTFYSHDGMIEIPGSVVALLSVHAVLSAAVVASLLGATLGLLVRWIRGATRRP